jgi:CheY-like chemotaxis protein/HPt (histidine-containing phosphotransfer) domain-containing protein
MDNAKDRKIILIVDDTPANIQILVEVLKDEYTTIVATNGEKALRLAAKDPFPDMILLDIMMPGMDGYEVCTKLKADKKTLEIPVIFVTAKSETEDELKGFELGAVDYITKPVSPPRVKARVRNHLALKEAKERLSRQNEELLEAARLREDVDNIARHDLKAPLNSIIGLPQIMLQEGGITQRQAEYLNTIEESGYTMLSMINLSLDLFKMERGIYQLKAVPVDVLKIIKKIISENKGFAKSKNISFQLTSHGNPLQDEEQLFIEGEGLLCYSMFSNLVKNAVEASPHGEALSVKLYATDMAYVHIHNKGTVPESIRNTFFEKYATAGKSGGTGLGTYSAKLIAEQQGGSIEMETSESEGTTITVMLPLGHKEERQEGFISESEQRNEQLMAALEQITEQRILLVDDDSFNLKILEKHLSHPKLILDFAENGKDACEKCIITPYDVVFMDMEMPVMNGLEAVSVIRGRERKEGERTVAIIALSGHDDDAARRKCAEAGFTDYLMKPAKREDLIKTILQASGADIPVCDTSVISNPATKKEAFPCGEENKEKDFRVRIDADLEELMPSFLKKKEAEVVELQKSLENNNFDEIRRLGHKLKGSFSGYGFRVMSEICAAIENSAKTQNREEIIEYLNRLKEYFKHVTIEYIKVS